MKKKSRLVIIKDILFHQLWEICVKIDDSQYEDISKFDITEYIRYNHNINYKKHKLDYIQFSYICIQTFKLSQLSFADILNEINKRKADISHEFCIPIRTIEDWYKGINICPAYIRLMILKQYHKVRFGKYMRLESEINFFKTIPPVYNERTKNSSDEIKDEESIDLIENDDSIEDSYYPYKSDIHYKREIIRTEKEREFFREYGFWPPQTTNDSSVALQQLLEKTAYIDKFVK